MKKLKGEGLGRALGGGRSDINGCACSQVGVSVAVRREGWDD